MGRCVLSGNFGGFRPSSKLKAPKLQIGVWLGDQRLCQPGLHLIRSWASRAMRITSAIRAGLERLRGKAFRGFERKIILVTCFPWVTMKTDQPCWGGWLMAARLGMLGRLPMPMPIACLLRALLRAGQKQRACIAASPCFAWCGTRRTVCFGESRFFGHLEFAGKFGVPQLVTINKSASYGVRWNRTRDFLDVSTLSVCK